MIGIDTAHLLLFIHALTGCATTCRPYGIGKVSALEKTKSLTKHDKLSMISDKSCETIEKEGQQALSVIYGSTHGTGLDFEQEGSFELRLAYIPPERFPPTADLVRLHSRRVNVPSSTGLVSRGNDLESIQQWGWGICEAQHGFMLKPHKMEQAPHAPSPSEYHKM